MKTTAMLDETPETQAIAELYQSAAQELLLAYQRNKEATRHHASGAFKAALHHARLSCVHSSSAHAHLVHALERSDRLSATEVASAHAPSGLLARRDH